MKFSKSGGIWWICSVLMMIGIVRAIIFWQWLSVICFLPFFGVVTITALIPDPMFTLRDRLWVIQSFLRGKVLRQRAYHPHGDFFHPPVPVSVKRVVALLRWWGRRPMTLDEVKALVERLEQSPLHRRSEVSS